MRHKSLLLLVTTWLLLLPVLAGPFAHTALAQESDLDTLCEPIALFPDALLSNVLIASTYPGEVEEAAAWSKTHSGVSGDDLEQALADKGWDASVKSMVHFPDVLGSMADNMEWTQSLGEAFQSRQSEVMAAVQNLRFKARSSGVLVSNDEQAVLEEDGAVVIQPTNPGEMCVPVYDSQAVFHIPHPAAGLIRFAARVALRAAFWSGVVDWSRRHVYFGRGYHGWYGGRVRAGNVALTRAYLRGRIHSGQVARWRYDTVRGRSAAARGYTRTGIRAGAGRPILGRS